MPHKTGLTTAVTQTINKKWRQFETSSCNIGGGGHINIQVPYMDAFYLNLSPKVYLHEVFVFGRGIVVLKILV